MRRDLLGAGRELSARGGHSEHVLLDVAQCFAYARLDKARFVVVVVVVGDGDVHVRVVVEDEAI